MEVPSQLSAPSTLGRVMLSTMCTPLSFQSLQTACMIVSRHRAHTLSASMFCTSLRRRASFAPVLPALTAGGNMGLRGMTGVAWSRSPLPLMLRRVTTDHSRHRPEPRRYHQPQERNHVVDASATSPAVLVQRRRGDQACRHNRPHPTFRVFDRRPPYCHRLLTLAIKHGRGWVCDGARRWTRSCKRYSRYLLVH